MTVETAVRPAFQWIGKKVPRFEDRRLLHGKGRFLEDLEPVPRAWHAAIVRSPHAHARIRSIDTTRASKMTGVLGVLTGEDVARMADPFPLTVKIPVRYYPLAVDRVRFVGEPVAVVVAENRYVAEDAAQAVSIEYEPLTPVVDIEAALQPDAPILHEQLGGNVANSRRFEYGDYDAARRQAHRLVMGRFRFPKVSSTPMETYHVVATYDPQQDEYTIWSNFHGPFTLHPVMAKALRVPLNRLRLLTPPDIGGSYGIKAGVYPYVVLIALAARKFGVPVRWVEDRLEHLMASSSGTDSLVEAEAAVDAEGRILGLYLRRIDNVGAYLRPPEPACLFRTHGNTTGPYDIPHLRLETVAVMTNKAPTGLNRGYGGPQLYFALERLVDRIARELSLDPAEVRRRNLIQPHQFPYRTASGGLYDSGDYPAALERTLALVDYERWRQRQRELRQQGRYVGIGLGLAVEPSGSNMGYVTVAEPPDERAGRLPKSGCTEPATVAIDPAGGITVRLTSLPQGQGHETAAAQIVAEELGCDPADVTVVTHMDTFTRPWTVSSGSYSSRFAPLTASAVMLAARRLKERLRRFAAHFLDVPPERLTFEDGVFIDKADPERRISLRRVAGAVHWNPTSLPPDEEPRLEETVFFSMDEASPPDETDRVDSSVTYGFVSEAVVVEVDVETGAITILDYVSVHDAGRVLNPLLADGQIYGGALHGLGAALLEELRYGPDGQLLTGTFMDYPCPTAAEAPTIRIDHLESPSPLTPLGAKGLGEGSTMTAPAALANAVADALVPFGVEPDSLPLTPHRVWALIRSAGDGSSGQHTV